MTASIHRLTTTPSASDTTADAITDSGLITIDTEAEVTALAWETIDFPDATTTDITSYLTVADVVSELGLFSVDLSTFLEYCATVYSCQYYAYANRYDGLALGHWVDFAAPSSAVSLDYDDVGAATDGDTVANLPAAVGLCDADTFICWGWYLEGVYTDDLVATGDTSTVTYAAEFSSGVLYWAFDDAVPAYDDVLTLFGTTLHTVVSSTSSTTGYGFSDVYWHTDADTTDAWPEGVLTYRFQAVDLPRYSVGDSISIWSLGSVTSSSANNEGATDVVLANAHMLFSTAAAASIVCSTLL
jgi:hypothetical protein